MRGSWWLCCGAVLFLLCTVPEATAQERSRRTARTTQVVTNPDGTTTTTVTEVRTVTRNGRTTTTRTTRRSGSAENDEPGTPPAPPAPASGDGAARAGPAALQGAFVAREALVAHNRVREQVGAPPLSWDEGLARLAQDWARHLCRDGRGARGLMHRPVRDDGPGENLWQGAATGGQIFSVSDAVHGWADERRFYDPKSGRCRGGVCGHYTQIIWRATTQVGCGAATCPDGDFGATVWACNYYPAGNVVGERP